MSTVLSRRHYFPLVLLIIFIFQGCQNQSTDKVLPSDPQGLTPKGSITIKRYEKALFELEKNNLRSGMASLSKEYSFFLGTQWQDTMNMLRIYNFLNDPNIEELFKLTIKEYPDVVFLEKELNDAFSLYLESYPEKTYPQVFTYVSGLDLENPVYYYDTAMAIGLDLFLGTDKSIYDKAGIPKYKISNLTKNHIVPQCMLTVSDHIIKFDENKNTLLDQMILAGKSLYFLDVTLPKTKDEYKIGYSSDQLNWARSNESNVWAFIIENQLLFSSDTQGTSKLMTDAPFTSGFAAESPSRIGAYLGWQIIRAYMQEAEDVTLKQLMENTDAQHILKESKFKPRKTN